MERNTFSHQIKSELLNLPWTNLEKEIILFAICKIKDNSNKNNMKIKLFKDSKIILLLDNQEMKEKYLIKDLKKHYLIEIFDKEWIKRYHNFFDNQYKKYETNNNLLRLFFVGYFLSSGWISNLGVKSYQLEITINNSEYTRNVLKQAEQFGINFKYRKRANRDIIYIKKANYISDFLKLILATKSLIDFEEELITKDMSNFVKRSEAIEDYNFKKISHLSKKHLEAIEKLKQNNKYNDLKKELFLISELRLQYPETSLNDLSYLYNQKYFKKVSKITIFNWINIVIELASEE